MLPAPPAARLAPSSARCRSASAKCDCPSSKEARARSAPARRIPQVRESRCGFLLMRSFGLHPRDQQPVSALGQPEIATARNQSVADAVTLDANVEIGLDAPSVVVASKPTHFQLHPSGFDRIEPGAKVLDRKSTRLNSSHS